MENNGFISKYGLLSSIIVTVVGVRVFSYPRELSKFVGADSWLIALLTGIICYILLYSIYAVVKINKYNSFSAILEHNLGKVLGKLIGLVFAFYNIFTIGIGMRIFIEVVKMYLLEKTPTEFILIIMILTGTFLVRGKIKTLIRFNEISFWLMVVPIIFIILFTMNKVDFTNNLPVFHNPAMNYMNALWNTYYSFTGFQIAYLIIPLVKDKEKINGTLKRAMIFITMLFLATVIFSIAMFGKEQTRLLLWPTITMIASINISGSFVERWEGVVMAIWVISYFTTFTNIYYQSADIIKDIFKLRDVKISSILVMPLIYVIALYPENLGELYDTSNYVIPLYAAFCLCILQIILLVASKINRKRVVSNE